MTVPDDPFQQLDSTPLGGVAKYLGYVCMAWSWLELTVDATLVTLLEPSDLDSSAAVVYNMDQRDKCRAVLALGFIKKPSDEWYSELKTLISEIDNDLRNERNRMVHDSWHHTPDGIFRLTNYAKVSREQARQYAIHFGEGKTVSPAELRTLMIMIFAAGGHLDDLLGRYKLAQQQPSPDKPA